MKRQFTDNAQGYCEMYCSNYNCCFNADNCTHKEEIEMYDCLNKYERITWHISLDRLADICEAERDGRCKVLPCKVGDTVSYKENPSDKSKVDSITIYQDNRVTFGFHEYGMKMHFVDEWSEDNADKYIRDNTLKEGAK